MDAKIVQVALSGLENILRFGEQEPKDTNTNYYANLVEECYGLDKIEFLQSHENLDIYRKVISLNSNVFSQILKLRILNCLFVMCFFSWKKYISTSNLFWFKNENFEKRKVISPREDQFCNMFSRILKLPILNFHEICLSYSIKITVILAFFIYLDS